MNKGQIFYYANPVMEPFAKRFGVVHKIDRKLFPGGMPNIMIHDMKDIQESSTGAHVVYFSQYESLEEKKMEEMIIFVFADTYNVNSLTIIDMYDPMATMERVTCEGVIASSNVDAHFWKTLPRLDSGKKITRILYDHHTLQNRFYFTGGSTNVLFKSAIPLLIEQVNNIDCIAYPDEGAYKRFSPYFKNLGWDTIICGKERQGDKRIVTIKEGHPEGKIIMIVDDLVRSGGTLFECATVLKASGAQTCNVFVTHAEFPNNAWKRFVNQDVIDMFYTTNSVYRTTVKLPTKDFVVLDLVPDLLKGNIF